MARITGLRPSPALVALVLVLLIGLGGAALAATGGKKAGPSEAVAFANVLEDGTIDPDFTSDNLADSNISNPTLGVYCFFGLPFTLNNAVVSGDNSFSNNDTIVSVAVDNVFGDGEDLSGCPPGTFARVRTLDPNWSGSFEHRPVSAGAGESPLHDLDARRQEVRGATWRTSSGSRPSGGAARHGPPP
jgi:hypothetical protein